ncbi:universal stress protein [Marinobacter sp. M216]|uniref:Universal stress protein n=1 Tax=Marinobacter albus TaxID=3030833 RepID=A0ABT7HED4_9GAMM|nr:universal stress protein [Marinobacter sp. M216]MDK9558215.1 universal stress protein [Marinobacter sp. M216]
MTNGRTDDRQAQRHSRRGEGRIVVLLDGSPMSYAALRAAANIAAQTGAEVLGVFVEEMNLLRSAGFSFSREVGSASGISRTLDTARVERRLQRLADHARQALAKAMEGRGGHHALSITRGRVIEEVLALAGPEDLLVLGRVGWSSAPGARLGSTARGLVQRSPGRVLLWCEQNVPARDRIVVFLNDHPEANERALTAAAEASRRYRQAVTALLCPGSSVSQEQLSDFSRDLEVMGGGIRLRVLPACDPATIAQTVRQEHASHLVISRGCVLFQKPGADQLLVVLDLPVTVTP